MGRVAVTYPRRIRYGRNEETAMRPTRLDACSVYR